MKRMYEKPVLYIERFTLSQTIADNCGDRIGIGGPIQDTKETCGWDAGGIVIFVNSEHCDLLTEELNGVCYNAPAGGNNVFNS